MGKEFVDFWTFLHFICGFISTFVLIPLEPLKSFFIVNVLHLIMELLENNKNEKTGEILETLRNHIGDVFFFFLGSLLSIILSYKFSSNKYFSNKVVRYIILFVLCLIFLQEILREIFPNDWIFDSSYKPIKWKI